MKLQFVWVDAFTTKAFSGNPCAVVLNANSLNTEQMLKIAKEFNLSETAFVIGIENDQVTARYFTPAEEIPMAGHPTISTIHALWEQQLLPKNSQSLKLNLPAGQFNIELNSDGLITMQQQKPKFMRVYDKQRVASAFSLNVYRSGLRFQVPRI